MVFLAWKKIKAILFWHENKGCHNFDDSEAIAVWNLVIYPGMYVPHAVVSESVV